jgi:hypothetical protein
VDAFTVIRIAGHSSIVVSQRYIHPTPEAVERAFERLQASQQGGRNRAQTTATRYNFRYTQAEGVCKLLKGL